MFSIARERKSMEDTNLPTDLVDVILSFHEPAPFCHSRLVVEFQELVEGRPWTCWSMLWLNWWGTEYQLTAPPRSRGYHVDYLPGAQFGGD